MKVKVCVPRPLTPSQSARAVRRSLEINPANAAVSRTVVLTPVGRRGGGRRLALVVGNRWPASGMKFTVQFLDNPSKGLKAKILFHMNAWSEFANVSFEETQGTGMVRIARYDDAENEGYWSYIGTQILGIEADQPTLNLDSFTLHVSDEEFRRVVTHEAGHTLGFDHEHMRSDLVKMIDPKKAIAYYKRTQGWSKQETIEQVLTPLSARSIMGTAESDPLSIMCYQIPAEITKDGKEIPGGLDITPTDAMFAAKVYSKPKARRAEAADPPIPPSPVFVDLMDGPRPDQFHIVILDEFIPQKNTLPRKSNKSDAVQSSFARVFASYGGAQVTSTMRLRGEAGAPTAFGDIIRVHERIKNYTNRAKGSLPDDEGMRKFGEDLFETLFQGSVRRLYDEARARQQNRKLDIVLTSMIPWLAEKPWEFAYDATRKSFLATEEIHLVRNVLTAVPANMILPRRGPLRILVAAAQPVGSGHLSVEQEIDVIRRGFEPLIEAGLVTVEVLARTTPRQIQSHLSIGNFNVVHLISHGKFDDKSEVGTIFFENEFGGEAPLSERSVREIFGKRGVSLVFLNACQTGSGGLTNTDAGVAQSLVSHGLPAVVANQYSVLDTSATSFAQHFYWSLAQGMSIGQAACEARIAVNCSIQGDIIDWAVPVVYARDPNMTLCVKPDKFIASSTPSMRRTSRRSNQTQVKRVAVWDTDSMFPSLEQTLETMNESQNMFEFELVALSTPIDAWDMENRSDDDSPYLQADKLALRLQPTALELRVDMLTCITRHWLRDDEWLNLYGWCSDTKPPIAIFSCAGFRDLAPEGTETDRAIANLMVTALAGYYGEVETHKRGPKNCPMYFNEDRDFAVMTDPQAFDKTCRTKLNQKMSGELPALDVLLKAFDEKG